MDNRTVASSRRGRVLFLVVLLLAGLLVYGASLTNGFVLWDDPLLILENPTVQGFTLTHLLKAFSSFDPDLYAPLTTLSYQLNFAIAGLSPFIYHLTNLLLHLSCAALVAWVTLQLTRKRSVAVITAFLFLVHPINVEAVAWASARKDVLSAFFALLSLGSFLRSRDDARRWWYPLSLLSFLCALLSKVSVLALPAMLLLAEWYRGKRITREMTRRPVPFVVLSIVFGIVALFGKVRATLPLMTKLLLGMEATLFSLFHLAWPVGYSVLYPVSRTISMTNPVLLLSLLVVIALCIGSIAIRKRFPAITFGWWWFLLFLAPSFLNPEKGSDVVPDVYLTSDRYAYVAATGIFLIVALALFHLFTHRPRIMYAVAGGLTVFLGALSFVQAQTWQNTETLFLHALSIAPQSVVAHNNLGGYYDNRGRSDDAARQYAQAIALGGDSESWFNAGVLAIKQKKPAEAVDDFQKSIALRPDFAPAQLDLGALLLDSGDVKNAIAHLLKAQSLDPENIATYLNLGIALEKGNDLSDAIRAYQRALALDPGNAYAQGRLHALGAQ